MRLSTDTRSASQTTESCTSADPVNRAESPMDPVLIFRKLLQKHSAMIGIRGTCAMGLPVGRDVCNHAQGAWNPAVAMRWGSSHTGELIGARLRSGLSTNTASNYEFTLHYV